MWVRFFHAIGLTNLSDDEIRQYCSETGEPIRIEGRGPRGHKTTEDVRTERPYFSLKNMTIITRPPLLWMWRSLLMPQFLKNVVLWVGGPRYIVGAVAIVCDDSGRVLLFKYAYLPRNPWCLPCVPVRREDIKGALCKRIREESHYCVDIHHVIGAVEWEGRRIDFLFACSISGEFRPSKEVKIAEYFDLDELPEMCPGHIGLLREIARTTGSIAHLDTKMEGGFLLLRGKM
jgi:hypothetical protein